MAKIKTKRKSFPDDKYTGSEPSWDNHEKFTPEEFNTNVRRSLHYYNYHYSVKDTKDELGKWLSEQKLIKISKQDISRVIKNPCLPSTVCNLIMAHNVGMPLLEEHINYIRDSISHILLIKTEDDTEITPKLETPKPNIQDRLTEKARTLIGEIEGWYDEIILGNKCDSKIYDFLKANNVPQNSVNKFENVFLKHKSELEEAQKGEDEQLKEAYTHFKVSDFKRHINWINDLLKGLNQYKAVKQATKKTRMKKAPSKDKLISKLKYAKTDENLKVVSINPLLILNATELWVYNTRTRKIGRYVVDATNSSLSVKGTSIIGYDENKSVTKTLRKPELQLAEFLKLGKVQVKKFMDTIKTTETKLTGRISEDVVLLKVL